MLCWSMCATHLIQTSIHQLSLDSPPQQRSTWGSEHSHMGIREDPVCHEMSKYPSKPAANTGGWVQHCLAASSSESNVNFLCLPLSPSSGSAFYGPVQGFAFSRSSSSELLAIASGRGGIPVGKVGVMPAHPSPLAWLLVCISIGVLY